MTGDCHVRICEGLGVKFPRATRRFRFVGVVQFSRGNEKYFRDCRKTLNLAIWGFSLVCKLLIFNDAKITGTRRLDFFDSLS